MQAFFGIKKTQVTTSSHMNTLLPQLPIEIIHKILVEYLSVRLLLDKKLLEQKLPELSNLINLRLLDRYLLDIPDKYIEQLASIQACFLKMHTFPANLSAKVQQLLVCYTRGSWFARVPLANQTAHSVIVVELLNDIKRIMTNLSREPSLAGVIAGMGGSSEAEAQASQVCTPTP